MQKETKIRCLIVEDEVPAQGVLREFISRIDMLSLAGVCSNAVEALNFLRQQPVDLLFLDIQMPQMTGTDFLRQLKNPPKVIFTTAYDHFAVEAFELEAADYLVKPVPFLRFVKAVTRVMDLLVPGRANDLDAGDGTTAEEPLPFLYFRSDRKMIKVFLQDILYIKARKDYLQVTTREKSIITKQSLSSLEEMLPEGMFLRTHRSFIVAVGKIDSYTAETIGIGQQQVPIGKLFRQEVIRKLAGSNGQ